MGPVSTKSQVQKNIREKKREKKMGSQTKDDEPYFCINLNID